MRTVTLRVLHGADRGRIFEGLATPVTVGREEGNTVQLNDERISRYHLKLQEDNGKIVLTDLESTNGTRVNGEDIRVRIVRDGDMIALGRSLLLIGSRGDIDRRIAEIVGRHGGQTARKMGDNIERMVHESDVVEDVGAVRSPLLPSGPPPLPGRLGPAQAAELSELLEYVQGVLRTACEGVAVAAGGESVSLDFADWQGVLDLQATLAGLLREIGEPKG